MRASNTAFFLAILVLFGGTSRSLAVGLTLSPVIRELQNADFTPVNPRLLSAFDPQHGVFVAEGSGPLIVTVDYYVGITGLSGSPGELGFGNVLFDLRTQNIDLDLGAGGWNPDTTLVDTNGEEIGGMQAIWSDNGDFGPSGTDLKSIVVGLAPRGFGDVGVDPRRTIGQAAPAYVGSTYFNWDPTEGETGVVRTDTSQFSTYSSSLLLRRSRFGSMTDGSLLLQVGSQPGDTDQDGDVDLDDLNNVRNHIDETGEGILGDTAPFDGVVDLEDLNRVRGNFGDSIVSAGGLTAVPEPGAFGLAVCGLIALAGYRNRRRLA